MKDLATGSKRYYRLIMAGSLLAAALWVTLVPTQPFSDFQYYDQLARQIARGGPAGDTYTAVGYPLLLAGCYWLFGPSLWVAKGLNLCLFFLNNWLALKLLSRLPLGAGSHRAVFFCFAFFPVGIYYTSIVGTETLFTSLLFIALFTYSGHWPLRYWLLGVVIGLASMVKPFFPAFAFVILLTDILAGQRLLHAAKQTALLLLVAALVLSPWLYRNYRLIGEFTYVSNNAGIVLYINNNSQNTSGGWMRAEDVADSLVHTPAYQAANMTEKNRMLQKAAKQWIKTHPREFLALGLKRLSRTFLLANDISYSLHGTGYSPRRQRLMQTAVEIFRLPVYLVGCLGVLAFSLRYFFQPLRFCQPPSQRPRLEIACLLTFWLFASVYFITEGQSRYAFPTILILHYFAANWLRVSWHKLRQRRS